MEDLLLLYMLKNFDFLKVLNFGNYSNDPGIACKLTNVKIDQKGSQNMSESVLSRNLTKIPMESVLNC